MSSSDPKTPPRQQHLDNADSEQTAQWRHAQAVNAQAAGQNAEITVAFPPPADAVPTAVFEANTIAPSPPPGSSSSSTLAPLNTATGHHRPDSSHSPLSAGLRIQTDVIPKPNYTVTKADSTQVITQKQSPPELNRLRSDSGGLSMRSMGLARTPSIKNILASSVGSAGSAPSSAFSSPMLNAMPDVTPLPSPLMSGDSPGPWKKLDSPRPGSRDRMVTVAPNSALVTANGESISSAIANQQKRRQYQGLLNSTPESPLEIHQKKNAEEHARNRSISEYVPEAMQVPKTRYVTVSGSHLPIPDPTPDTTSDGQMRREPNLAVQRGIAPIPRPPTPPSSRTGGESSDSDSSLTTAHLPRSRKPRYDYFEAYTRDDSKKRRWRALKILGEGTFSKVMLATSEKIDEGNRIDENDVFGQPMDGVGLAPESKLDRKKLVAIKICEHGPKGGASEDRIEMSLKRELEILKSISHPSLVHLKAWNIEETRAILVLSYCPGGDLFEVASQHRELLVPGLLRRMFAELVAAVQYLHERHIVHRDIKLENVLVNLPQQELSRPLDWTAYPYSIVTLTDLGLSRRVADDEKLTTRCGSDDYAAPEVIMGQPYDGRATDAWSLGVLLYALLESRLPFDHIEGHKQRSRTSHRIARVEWRWVEYAGDEGDHEGDPEKFKARGLLGAMNVTEGLLKRARSRWGMEKVAAEEWVQGGINVDGGIKFREEDLAEEVKSSDSGAIQSPL